jgi:maleate isomerase
MAMEASHEITATEPVRASWTLDDGPGRHRIGLIALATDHATERDFMNMRPSDDVVIYTSRLLNQNPCNVENLRAMAPRLTDAAALILPESRLDVIAYSCTSGTVMIGHDAVAANIQAARPGVPCVTPIEASLAGLRQLGASRIAVLTPYIDEVNEPMRRYIEKHGPEIVAFTSFHMADDNHMACLPPEAIHQAAIEADRPEAEALFISCTAIRAVEVIERIERDIGKPVVSAIQAMFWQALRLSGYSAPVAGYGRLLTLPAA